MRSVEEYKKQYGTGWLRKYNADKKRLKPSKVNDERINYYTLVKELTESNKIYIEGIEKRGWDTFHLDHKIAIAEGYSLSIPPEVIAHPSNLRIITAEENMNKRAERYVDEKNNWIVEKYM